MRQTPLETPDCPDLVVLLRKQATDRPAHGFAFEQRSGVARLTFADLDRRAQIMAKHLRDLHPQAESAILCFPPGLHFLVGFFASLYAGVTAVPAYPPRPRRADNRLEAIAGDSPAAVVLTTPEILQDKDRLAALTPRLAALAWLEIDTAPAPTHYQHPSSRATRHAPLATHSGRPAVLQYTSGSTALPKGVMLTQASILHNLRRMQEILGLGPTTRCVCWLPAFHDMGLIGNLLQGVASGMDITLLSPAAVAQDPLCWLETISKEKAYVSGGPGFAFQHCLDRIKPADRDRLDLSSWRVAYVGAEPVSAGVLERFSEFFAPCGFRPEAFFPTYGLAEGTLMVTGGDRGQAPVVRRFQPASLETRQPIADDKGRAVVACGRPLPDMEVCIVDPSTCRPVPPGEIGEIWVAGPSVAAGYWNRPEETAQTFAALRADGCSTRYLRTGDLGFLQDQLFITGRLKELIIIRGRNYYPQDLEEAVASLPELGYHRGAAFTVDEGCRPRLVMVHEVVRGYRTGQATDLFARARQIVAETFDLELSALVLVRTASLPRATSGKIRRGEARRRFEAGTLEMVEHFAAECEANDQLAEPGFDATLSPRKASVADIRAWLVARLGCQTARPLETIDVGQPFASFGLDSVTMVSIAADLEKWLGRPLPQTLLYDAPTIARLAQSLAGAERADVADLGQPTRVDAIAIIGLGCRFPEAANPEEFWQLLRAGRCVIRDLPVGRWPALPTDKITHQGGFLVDVQHFDAAFFGIAPREAVALDPQQRLLLEVAWETLEHAGVASTNIAASEVGVFVGIATSDYGRLLLAGGAPPDAYVASGNALSMAAHRLSYHLDLRGPSMAVDTACSSSLVAVHLACQALRAGECGLALAGGVNLILSGDISANLAQAQMLSPVGRCQTFDAAADGYVRGEGCGLVLLKSLAAALRDGNTIYAVVEGSAVNQDGRSNGITAPNKTAQVEVIGKALRQAQCSADAISYVEMHGTGTPLGDPIEFEALAAALGSASTSCALGAVKTNLGHLESAAGIASLIKTVLQIHHAELVPHLHLRQLNPLIALAGSRFHVPLAPAPWTNAGRPRRAGVSSFGFGGTNAHLIIAQPPAPLSTAAEDAVPVLLPLSARTPQALRDLSKRYADWLLEHPDVPLAAVCATASHGRTHFPYRLALVAQGNEEMAAALRHWTAADKHPDGAHDLQGRIAFLFTGQGAQYAGMAKRLQVASPIFRANLERCAELLQPNCSWSLFDALEDEARLEQTDVAQPALFALEYALARTWQAWGIDPAAVLGHSAGEYVAACIAGVFSLEDGLRLIVERGRAMQACPAGAMLACFAPLELVQEMIGSWGDRLALAAVNGPENIVISGDPSAIVELQARLAERGIGCRDLRAQRAFHSVLIEPAFDALRQAASGIAQQTPLVPMISNVSGDFLKTPPDADFWVQHARQPVRFAEGMRALHGVGITHFVEIGPDMVLSRLGPTCIAAKNVAWLGSLSRRRADDAAMLESLARFYQDGATIRWENVLARRPGVVLPTYPFQRQRFWFGGTPRLATLAPVPVPAPRTMEWLPLSNWLQPLPRFATGLEQWRGNLATTLAPALNTRAQSVQLDRFAKARRQFDGLAADFVAQAFTELGWQPAQGQTFNVTDVATTCGVLPRHERLFRRLLAIGAEEGWFRVRPGQSEVIRLQRSGDSSERQELLLKEFPEFDEDMRLVRRCGTNLAAVLRGDKDSLDILFGAEAEGLAERLYEHSPVALFYNGLMKRALEQLLLKWPADRPIRVLELGGGTGGSTAHLLPLFPAHNCEYVFTDVSPLFLAQAREKFKAFGHVQYRLLDLEASPGPQGFADGQFDLVLAANVLHATGDLRRSVGNIRKLLVPAGLLILLEGTRPTRVLDLIFGLTDGWWKFTDTSLRPDYPLLSPKRWSQLLNEEKFTDVVVLPPSAEVADADQAVIVAMAPPQSVDDAPAHRRNGQAGKNGAALAHATWLVIADGSPLIPLLVERLCRHGDHVEVVEAAAAQADDDTRAGAIYSAVVFGSSVPSWLASRSSRTWLVTSGQAPFKDSLATGHVWTAPAIAQGLPKTFLIDLDPAHKLEMQLQCLLASLLHHDDQPAVAFRGDQRYIPRRLEAPLPESVAAAQPPRFAGTDLAALPAHERRAWLEEHLLAEFAAIANLALSRDDRERPFQALGLDSLMAIQFRNRLEASFGSAPSVVDFLNGLSLNQLVAQMVDKLGPASEPNVSVKIATSALATDDLDAAGASIPLSYNQQALWFVHQLAPTSPAYNFVFAAHIAGSLDSAALVRAFGVLMQRHPALRTRFAVRDTKPVQIIEETMALNIPVRDVYSKSAEEIDALCKQRADEPFDLERGPALRVELLRLTPTDTVLLLVCHHIIIDLWSMDILLQQLEEAYLAEAAGKAVTPAPVTAPFVDYVRRQLGTVHGPRGQQDWDYWRRQLAGELPVLNLPTDRPRPLVQTYRGTSYNWPLEQSMAAKLRALAQAQRATPFMALLAVFQALLYRYTGQQDFLVGTATADRARPEWQQAVGYFLNQVALRANVTGADTFQTLLARARDQVHQALEHQEFPFGLLVKRLQPRRDPGRPPIFQVMFIWDKTRLLVHPAAEQPHGTGPGLHFQPLLMEQRGAPFDLTLIVFETGDRLTASLRYNTDLFDRETIERMAGHFNTLLGELSAAPQLPLSEIGMLSSSERTCLLETWNDTARPYAPDSAFPQIFEQHACQAAQAPAVFFEDQIITYGELNTRANQLARYLQRLGVRRGQTLALSLPRCPEMIVSVLAAWKLGVPYLYLDPLYPINRLKGMIQESGPAALIAPAPLTGLAVPTIRLAEDWSTIANESQANLDLAIVPDDLAYIIYTSGSTGQPKGTMLRHRGLSNLRVAQDAVFAPGRTDRVLQYASLSFDASVFEIVMALGAGGSLVLAAHGALLPGPGLLKLLRDQAVTIATLPPSVPAILSPANLPALHTLIVAGEACSAEVVSTWCPGRRMFNAYGPTEATVWSTVAQCVADGKAPSIGRPIANTRAYILDANLQPVPVGVPGELYLAGVGLAAGYLNRPELTAERFLANPFSSADEGVMYRTGDLVRRRADGAMDFIGRRDLQLKLRGYRVELEEIQEVLRQHPAVADALVVAKTGTDGQTALNAYVVARTAVTFPLADVRDSLRAQLPHYMIPASVSVLERFPLTVSGKVDRDSLPELGAEVPIARAITAARQPSEKQLAGIWERVLRVDAVGIHDNFFDLGGASIQTLEVVTLANQAGLDVTPEMIFRHQTIAELAEACGPPHSSNGHKCNGHALPPSPDKVTTPRCAAAAAPKATGGGALIESLGIYLPPREVTTEQVLQGCRLKLDFPLERMTGIRARRMAGETEFAIDLAATAVADCLARSAYAPADIDLLICSNISRYDAPDFRFTMEPTTAARLRARFGFTNALAFDVTNACAGTFTALHVVDALLRQGVIRRAMVVSGEYITHLTLAAQREIESFMDPRLACLTLGDSGMAMILEQAPSPAVGFQDIDMYTLGKYHNLCVAKASANPEGGAIMFTDPIKSAAVTIKEAVKHCLEALERHHWAPDTLKWLIMHQTSEVTLDGAIREINRVAGNQAVSRANTVFHLARRGNTATNSHFLAVRENIDAGNIAAGDKVFFAISGSGQVVGSALYVFDDLPARDRKPTTNISAPQPRELIDDSRNRLRMFPCLRRVSIASVGVLPGDYAGPTDSVTLLRAAGEACLGRRRRKDIDLVLHTGTYRSDFLCEPALAAIAAGELHINHDDESPTGKRTFAFDLTSGAVGTLTGCMLAGQLLGAGKYTRALLLASEVENNAVSWPEHLVGLKETASALLLEEGSAGFSAFGFRTFPEHVGRVESFTVAHNKLPALGHRHDPDLDAIYINCIGVTVAEFLAKAGVEASAIRWFLLPQRSANFVANLADALAVPRARVVFAPDGKRDYFTSSLAHTFHQAQPNFATGDLLLIVEAAAGIQVACALYEA